jgi:putative cell wall-binding protein
MMNGFDRMANSGRRSAGAPHRFARALGLFLVVSLAAVGIVAVQPAVQAQALDGSQFNAGTIIDDSNFYNGNAMSQAQIQTFLEEKEPGTCGNTLCLKLYTETTPSRPQLVSSSTGRVRCNAYTGGTNDTAAAIIFKAQQACGISAKVILVTLQKEQGLVTKTAPSSAAMQRAMGYGCPDTAPCAVTTLGFGNQVYTGALQLNTYRAANFGMQPGLHTIAYNPTASCGTKSVQVTNYATAALYNYTPYTPNDAALANLYGTAPPCGAYGNRNFWVYYSTWFGDPQGNPQGSLQSLTVSNNAVVLSGWAADPDVPSAALNIQVAGNGWTQTIAAGGTNVAAQGAFSGAGSGHGFSATVDSGVGPQQICVTAINQSLGSNVSLGCQTVTVTTTVSSTLRIGGTDRYDTAVQIAKANFTTPGIPVVYVASGENFPDALSVVPIAAAQGAPLLLVTSGSVPQGVLDELNTLQPKRIIVVGGEQAISPAVYTVLSTVAGLQKNGSGAPDVTRVQGVDRYQTSIAIGDSLYAPPAVHPAMAYVAIGANFPDAISAAAAAGHTRSPLVLIDGGADAIPADIAAALQRWGVSKITVVGGVNAISDQLLSALNAIAPATRVSGPDRYATSVAINAAAFPSAAKAYIATGSNYADGLTGGAVAGAQGDPMFLAQGSCVPQGAIGQIVNWSSTSITLLGGIAALDAGVETLTPC